MEFLKTASSKKIMGVSLMTIALMAASFYIGKKYY
jgi:hypothetical protein